MNRDKVITSFPQQIPSGAPWVPNKHQHPTLFQQRVHLKVVVFSDFTASRVAPINMEGEAESKPILKLCQSLTCSFGLCLAHDIYPLSHRISLYLHRRMLRNIPLDFQTNIQPRQGFIHATADSSGGTAPSVPWLCLPAHGKSTHRLQTGLEVRGQKLREVEPLEGRGKFTKWIERKSRRCGEENKRE